MGRNDQKGMEAASKAREAGETRIENPKAREETSDEEST